MRTLGMCPRTQMACPSPMLPCQSMCALDGRPINVIDTNDADAFNITLSASTAAEIVEDVASRFDSSDSSSTDFSGGGGDFGGGGSSGDW